MFFDTLDLIFLMDTPLAYLWELKKCQENGNGC